MKISNSNIRIKQLISELNISQTEFCKKTGLAKSALSNYMNGDRQPRQDQIDKIAAAYNVNPAWLMGYDVPKDISENYNKNSSGYFEYLGSFIVEENGHITYSDITDLQQEEIESLVEVAKKCTCEQISIATDLLTTYSKRNQEEQRQKIQEAANHLKESKKILKQAKLLGRRKHESKKTT